MNQYVNWLGAFGCIAAGAALAYFLPQQQLYAGSLIGIGVGWLGKHLSA